MKLVFSDRYFGPAGDRLWWDVGAVVDVDTARERAETSFSLCGWLGGAVVPWGMVTAMAEHFAGALITAGTGVNVISDVSDNPGRMYHPDQRRSGRRTGGHP
jgi:hypothetical protein